MAKAQIKVKGLHCGGCVKRLHRALTSVAGVSTAEVVLETGAVTVEYDAAKVTEPALKTVVVDTGFEVIAA
jgi:copper chaperone